MKASSPKKRKASDAIVGDLRDPEKEMTDFSMKKLDDYRLMLAGRELVPLMQGGMGVNISTQAMALAVAHAGGNGHVSDAMLPDLADRLFETGFTKMKAKFCRAVGKVAGYAGFEFPLDDVRAAAKTYLGDVMAGKTGPGLVFVLPLRTGAFRTWIPSRARERFSCFATY